MITVYTLVSPDGVIGLNGAFYLEEDDGSRMLFKSMDNAKKFLSDQGEDPENEFIDYTEIDENDVEHDLYHDGSRGEEE